MNESFYKKLEQNNRMLRDLKCKFDELFSQNKQQLQSYFSFHLNCQVKFLYYDICQHELHLCIKSEVSQRQQILNKIRQYQTSPQNKFFIFPIFVED